MAHTHRHIYIPHGHKEHTWHTQTYIHITWVPGTYMTHTETYRHTTWAPGTHMAHTHTYTQVNHSLAQNKIDKPKKKFERERIRMNTCQAGPGKEATMQVCMPWGSFLSPAVKSDHVPSQHSKGPMPLQHAP